MISYLSLFESVYIVSVVVDLLKEGPRIAVTNTERRTNTESSEQFEHDQHSTGTSEDIFAWGGGLKQAASSYKEWNWGSGVEPPKN